MSDRLIIDQFVLLAYHLLLVFPYLLNVKQIAFAQLDQHLLLEEYRMRVDDAGGVRGRCAHDVEVCWVLADYYELVP